MAEHKYFERISVVLLLVSIGNIFLLENIMKHAFFGLDIIFLLHLLTTILLFIFGTSYRSQISESNKKVNYSFYISTGIIVFWSLVIFSVLLFM